MKRRQKSKYIWKFSCPNCFAAVFYYIAEPISGQALDHSLAFRYDGTQPKDGESIKCLYCDTGVIQPGSQYLSKVKVDKTLEDIMYKLNIFDKIK